MCFAFNDFWRRSIAVVIKHAKTEFHVQLMPKHRVQRLFRDLALRIGGFATVLPMEVRNHIDAGLQFLFKPFREIVINLMIIHKAATAADVCHDGSAEAPFRPQDVLQQMAVDAAGDAVQGVVRRHDG